METKAGSVTTVTSGGPSLGPKALERVRDILHQLANTVSVMKLFPSEHANVQKSAEDLIWKFKSFLAAHGKLEIWISEFSFVCGDTAVYSDDIPVKSLPFFFFKDGMQKLYFYQGLNSQEILDFLDVIKTEARKPAGDSDVVSALWEKDLAHIQYYAPDDYLENKILEECGQARSKGPSADQAELGQKSIEIRVDTSKFSKGKIELSEEDREIVRQRSAIEELAKDEEPRIALEKAAAGQPASQAGPAAAEPQQAAPESREKEEPGEEPVAGPTPVAARGPQGPEGETEDINLAMTEPEFHNLEALISSSRSVSPDEEFLNLMVEILNLEKDRNTLVTNLDVLMEYQLDQLQQANFVFAVLLVLKLRELRDYLSVDHPEQSALVDSFLKRISGGKTLEAVKKLFESHQQLDWDSLVDFIRLLGKPALPLAADIYESIPNSESQKKILDFIREANAGDPGALARLAADERPGLSRAIISFLSRDFGKKGLPHFAVFVAFKDPEIKREVIRVLGEARDETAGHILLGFLKDKNEDIRIEAIFRLDPAEAKSRVRQLVQEASSGPFRAKSLKEKQAFLAFIGRTRAEEALDFLRKTIEKRGLWMSARTREMKIAAVSGLEKMGTDEAVGILQKGARAGNKALREACVRAVEALGRQKAGQRKADA
jgi:HEAT repeat protein